MLRCLLIISLALTTALPAQSEALEEARQAAAAGKHEKAVELIEGAWSDLKTNAVALELIASSTYELGRFGATMDYAVKLTEVDKTNPAGFKYGALGFFWSAEDRKASGGEGSAISALYEESAAMNRRYLDLKPEDHDQRKLLGHTFYWLNEQEKAIEAFSKAHAGDANDVDALFFKSRSERVLNKWGDAINSLDAALRLKPDAIYIQTGRAEALKAAGRGAEAARAFASILATKSATLDEEARSKWAWEAWLIWHAAKNYDDAIKGFDGWIKVNPKSAYAYWYKGFANATKGDDEEAIKAYAKSFKLSGGKQADAAASVGDAYARMATPRSPEGQLLPERMDVKHLTSAAEWYLKAHAVSGWDWRGNPPLLKAVGLFNYMASNGKLREGAELLEKVVIPAAPKQWQALNNLGLYYRDLGGARRSRDLCDKSREYYDRAAAAIRESSTATAQEKAGVFNDAGVLYGFPNYRRFDMDKAMAYYREALEADPNWIDANENMGLCMNQLGRHKEAIPFFDKVLEQHPERRVSRRGKAAAERALK